MLAAEMPRVLDLNLTLTGGALLTINNGVDLTIGDYSPTMMVVTFSMQAPLLSIATPILW